jgi:hypothetical protein
MKDILVMAKKEEIDEVEVEEEEIDPSRSRMLKHKHRTVDDFITDERKIGRNDCQILSVAGCSRWLAQMDEVKKVLKNKG